MKNFYNSLKDGGKFLMHTDVNIPFVESGKYKFDETRELKNGDLLQIIDRYNPETKRIDGSWIVKNALGREIKKDYSVRVYSKDEFEGICKEVGFTKVDVFSNWEGQEYSKESENMIVVATK